jgi:hypothetical protein
MGMGTAILPTGTGTAILPTGTDTAILHTLTDMETTAMPPVIIGTGMADDRIIAATHMYGERIALQVMRN